MNKLCVFMGSSFGKNPAYLHIVKQLGEELVKSHVTLIYGGSKLGLMGMLANTVLENGGRVIGVITKHLYTKEAHLGLSELEIVESMPERKRRMVQLADGFIALPGGLGTLEEIFEVWNASKLKLHNKPLGLLNTDHYFDKLIAFMDHAIREGFLKEEFQKLINIHNDPIILLSTIIKHYS